MQLQHADNAIDSTTGSWIEIGVIAYYKLVDGLGGIELDHTR
jgi:hypothetical protein